MAELQDDIMVEDMGGFQQDPEPKLSEAHRRKLDSIIVDIYNKGATKEEIQTIVDDYKKKYATKPLVTPQQQQPEKKPAAQSTGLNVGNLFPNLKKDFPQAGTPIEPNKPGQISGLINRPKALAKASEANKKIINEIHTNDDVIEHQIRQQRFDVAGQQQGAPASETQNTGMRIFQEPTTKPQDEPVTAENINEVKLAAEADGAAARKVLQNIIDRKPEKKRDIQHSVYLVDAVRDAGDNDKRLHKILNNAKEIEKGGLVYSVRNGMLIRPQGVIGSLITGWQQKSKAFDDFSFLDSKTPQEIIDEYEKRRIEYDPDEPIPVPKHKLGEISQMLGGMPFTSLIAGGLTSVAGAPEAAPVVSGVVGAADFYKMRFAGTFGNVYNQLRDEGKTPEESFKAAYAQAQKEATVDAAVGGLVSFGGMRLGTKPLAFSSGYKAAATSLIKEGGLQSVIGGSGELLKNKLAQAAGIKRDVGENVLDVMEGNFFMTLGIGALAKLGAGIPKIKYRAIQNGLKNVDESVIENHLNSELSAGRMTEQQVNNVRSELKSYKELDSQIPANITEEARLNIQKKLEKRNELEGQLETLNKAFHPEIKEKIAKIDEDIAELSKQREPKEKQDPEIKEAKLLIDDAIGEGVMSDVYAAMAKENPEGFMKFVADQSFGRTEEGVVHEAGGAEGQMREQFGDAVVDHAKEMFPLEEKATGEVQQVESDLKKQLKEINAPQNVIDAISDKAILEKRLFLKENIFRKLTASGVYYPETDSITLGTLLSRLSGKNKVLLHEAVHAATVHSLHEIDGWLDRINELTPEQRDLYWSYSDLHDTFNDFKKILKTPYIVDKLTKNDLYGLTNVYEFVAEFISNKNFRNTLQQYSREFDSGKKVNIVKYIWDKILRLTGLKKQQVNDEVISEIQSSIDKILEHSKNTRGALSKISEVIKESAPEKKSSVSVIRPEEQKQHETITIKPKDNAISEQSGVDVEAAPVFKTKKEIDLLPEAERQLAIDELIYGVKHESKKDIFNRQTGELVPNGTYNLAKFLSENEISGNETAKKLLDEISKHPYFKNVKLYITDRMDGGVKGEAIVTAGLMKGSSKMDAETVAHEMMHFLTSKILNSPYEGLTLSEKKFRNAVTQIIKQFDPKLEYLDKVLGKLGYKRSEYTQEVIAEAFTGSWFAKELQGKEVNVVKTQRLDKNLIQKIVDKIIEFFGGKISERIVSKEEKMSVADALKDAFVTHGTASEARLKELNVPNGKYDVLRSRTANSAEAIKRMREAGFSEEEIKSELSKRGIPYEVEGGGEPPVAGTSTGSIFVQRPGVELSHSGLQDVANEFSLPDVQSRERKSDIQLRTDAEIQAQEWAAKGEYAANIERLTQEAEQGKILTDKERLIMEQHLANLMGEARAIADKTSPEYAAKFAEISRLKKAGEKTRSEAGAALRIPGTKSIPTASPEDMIIAKEEAVGRGTTPEEKAQVNQQFQKIDKAKKSFSAKGKEIADRIRALRPKTDTASAQFFGLPIAIYDTAIVTIANAVEAGANLADAIQIGIAHIRQNGGFKNKKDEKLFAGYVKGQLEYDQRLNAYKERTKKSTERLQERAAAGDFEPDVKTLLELDEEARQLKKEYRQAKYEFELELQKDKLRQRPFHQKAVDVLLEPLRAVRTLMTTLDFSAVLRQGIIPTIAHPTKAAKAIPEMFKQTFDKARFDEWLADVKEGPLYDVMEKSKLYIADPNTLHLSAKEENFMSNLAEKIPVVKEIVKASERAYVSYLNKMRVDLFRQGAEVFTSEGKTIHNSPELYEGLANFINNATGRGKLGPLEGSADFLNTVFFSPRLMASRMNMLGLTDIFTAGQKGFYSQLPKEVRVMAMKDMMKFIAFGVSVLGLSKLAGADVEDDPRSTDFGKMKFGNTRYDIWGGFQPYVRLIAQVATGQTKSTGTGEIKDLTPKKRFDRVTSFMRGKLAPVPGSIVDLAAGENIIGEPVTLKSEAIESVTPMIINDVGEAMKDQGIKALFTVGVPSIFGISSTTYDAGQQKSGDSKNKRAKRPERAKRPSRN